ncbi:hypothetical protein UT300005_33860 [Clostridium sp. CTA-5]
MNKKFLSAVITVFLLLSGCSGNATQSNVRKSSEQSSSNVEDNNTSKSLDTNKSNDSIDYSQYVSKTWVDKNGTNNASFCISKIADGKITGRFASNSITIPGSFEIGQFNGTINKDTAECQFSDNVGNKGNIKLVFKSNKAIEVSINLTDKLQDTDERPKEGSFQYKPYTINDVKGFSIINSQSFKVSLNSWGNVKFVSGKLIGGSHIPIEFYLVDNEENILYYFDNTLPYGMDIKAVSFEDVNNDSLKDVIVIVESSDGGEIATVFLQKFGGTFAIDTNLDNEINNSGNNKDINSVKKYLSKKF